jgi:hypothetical protein
MIHRYIIEATDEVKGFEEAIERLDREWGIEELEPCEDTISRQDALDCLTATGLKKFDFILDARDKIKKLPSVTPQYTDAEIQKMQELEQAEIEKAYELGKASQPKTRSEQNV